MAAGDVDAQITTLQALNCNVFDGVDDYVEIPHDNRQLGVELSKGLTLSAWINPETIGETNGYIFDKSTGTGGNGGFRYNISATDNKIDIAVNGGGLRSSANNAAPFGLWTHVLVTIAPTTFIASHYINGVVSGTPAATNSIAGITTTNAMRIGNRSSATDRTFDGGIRDVKMWNRVLTQAEITREATGANVTNGLIHWFKLGGDYADYGEVGVAATNSGSSVRVIDDNVATAVSTQRTTTLSTGTFIFTNGMDGQIYHAAITET